MKGNALKLTKKKWTILSLMALVLVLGGAVYYYSTTQSSKSEATVQTSTVDTGDIILTATGLGTLVAKNEVSFGFSNIGTVSEVLVKLGDPVEEGQVLARQENDILTLEYSQAESNLAALKTPGEVARAAQAVEDAKLAFATAQDDLQHMIGPDMLNAEENLAAAQQELNTAQSALQQDASDASQQKVSEAQANVQKAQDALTYAYYNYSNSYTVDTFTYPIRNDKGVTIRRDLIAPTDAELLAARAAYDLAAANLSDAENYLDILNGVKATVEVPASSVTTLTDAKLALDSAKSALDATQLVAPISGTVTSLTLNTGSALGTDSAVTISDTTQPYLIDASLDETDWDKARVGYDASVTFDLLPNDSYSGNIVQVHPKLDDSSGTNMVHILVQLDEKVSKDLPVGSTASVEVTGGEALDALLVPVSALKEAGNDRYTAYLLKNGQPVEQEVEIGLQDILYAEVKSGLKKGDVVVTDISTVDQ